MTQKKEQRPSELRARLNAKCKEQGVSLERDSSDNFLVSYSTLNRHLNLEKALKPTLINKLSQFLEVSDEEVIAWHGKAKTEFQEDDETQQNTKKNKKAAFFGIFSSIVAIVLIIMMWTQSNASKPYQPITQTSTYNGKSIDIDLSTSAGLKDFSHQLYKYEFNNAVIKITGENIIFNADIQLALLSQPEIKFMGTYSASGKYLNGHAAMSYKATMKPNNAVWLGVLMLDLSDTGPSNGYWLTILNSVDKNGFGDFAFGNMKMDKALNSADKK